MKCKPSLGTRPGSWLMALSCTYFRISDLFLNVIFSFETSLFCLSSHFHLFLTFLKYNSMQNKHLCKMMSNWLYIMYSEGTVLNIGPRNRRSRWAFLGRAPDNTKICTQGWPLPLPSQLFSIHFQLSITPFDLMWFGKFSRLASQ
jgi:hypothetical protein